MEEDEDSFGEDMAEPTDFPSLKLRVENVITKIGRKKENLEEFVTSIKKENAGNKKVIERLHEIEEYFKEGKRSRAELDGLLKRIKERHEEVGSKCGRIVDCLDYIIERKDRLDDINESLAKERGNEGDELSHFSAEVASLFGDIIAKFRECKKLKISLSKSKIDDVSQTARSWEKASDVARELSREIRQLQMQLVEKDAILGSTEEELEEERERYKETEEKMTHMWNKFDLEEKSKAEQAHLINAIRRLLDESEKLVRNLESQNQSLNHNISEERKRVSDLREKLSDLQGRVEYESKQNRDLNLQLNHIKDEFLEVKSQNEGYERDMDMITKELVGIRDLKHSSLECKDIRDEESQESDSVDELEDQVKMKDKMLEDKYIEVQRMEADSWRYTERIKSLEEEVLWKSENYNTSVSKLQSKERDLEQLTEFLKDTQTKLQTEKLVKDEYIIKCDILESKLSLMEKDEERDTLLQLLQEEKERSEELYREAHKFKMLLQEEQEKSEESSAIVEDLEDKLAAETEYSNLIKSKSLENITYVEQEKKKLFDVVQDLRHRLNEKDSGIEELIVTCAVEELKLREEIASLGSHVQIRKRDSIFKGRVIQRLRQEVVALKRGLGTFDEDDEENEGLEKLLQEERVRVEKYEDALLALNKQYEETENQIREKDFELSRKSAEDGKKIAGLLQEVEANKTTISDLETQMGNLEGMLSLQEKIKEAESNLVEKASLEEDLEEQKHDYAVGNVKRKDEIIKDLRNKIESLNEDLMSEEKRLKSHEALITDLNDANIQDVKRIEDLTSQVENLEEQIDELTEKVVEGQRLISEVEGIADRERIRALALEELLAIDKGNSKHHQEIVEELKMKVESYQSNVGELKKKVDRMRREIHRRQSSEDEDEDGAPNKDRYGPVRRLHEKLSSQKQIIQDLKVNVSAVEERNERLDEQLREQRDRNDEQDEKINLLMSKSLECEDVIGNMMEKLEMMRERYIGLSGLSDEDQLSGEPQVIEDEGERHLRDRFFGLSSIAEEDAATKENVEEASDKPREELIEEVREVANENPIVPTDITDNPLAWFPNFMYSSSNESEHVNPDKTKDDDEEQKAQDSDNSVYYESKGKSQDEMQSEVQHAVQNIPYDPMLIEHLIMFEKVFENIFTEEGRRVTLLLEKFQGVIEKNAEFFVILQDFKRSVNNTRVESEMKTRQIKEMEEQIEDLLRKESGEAEKFKNEVTNKDQKLAESDAKVEECYKTIEELNITLRSRQETIEYLSEKVQLEKNNYNFKEALVHELEQRLENERRVTEQITKALEEEEERTLQLSEVLTAEQVKGVEMTDRDQQLKKQLDEEENRNKELSGILEDEMNLVNQLKENIAVEHLIKSDHEKEIENLKNKLMEEREAAERLREEYERDTNARYQAEGKLSQLEEELYAKNKVLEELQVDLETERKCYKIVSERLEAEQNVMSEMEERVKKTEEVAVTEKTTVEELNTALSREQIDNVEYKYKLERMEQETKCKTDEISSLMYQLDEEKTKIDSLLADIDLQKMTKSNVEAKLKELEEQFNKDEQIFDELRETIDAESSRNREISELFDKERTKNVELEEKIKELDTQVLLDLQLFDELRMTIEHERETNRELDELLNSGGGFNNRDNLLAELDGVVSEMKRKLEEEKQRNEDLQEELRKRQGDTSVDDLKEILNSQILHTAELKGQLESESETRIKLEDKNKDHENKLSELEKVLKSVKDLSSKVSKELEEDSDLDEEDAPPIGGESGSDDSPDRDLLRVTTVLNKKKDSKKKLKSEIQVYKNQLTEKDVLLTEIQASAEATIKAETEKVSMWMEEREFRNRRTIDDLKNELDSKRFALKEREEENETFKKFYEEERDFARQKLDMNKRLSERLEEFESMSYRKEEEITSLRSYKEKSEEVERQLEEKSGRLKVTEEDVMNLQRVVEELSSEKSKLESGKSDIESLNVYLKEKDREISRLKDAYRSLDKENGENEKCIMQLQHEIMRLRPLVKQNQDSANKSVTAMTRSKLLFEALQTDAEIKSLQMDSLRQEVDVLRSQARDKAKKEVKSPDVVDLGSKIAADKPQKDNNRDKKHDGEKDVVLKRRDEVDGNNNNNKTIDDRSRNMKAVGKETAENSQERKTITLESSSDSKDIQITRLKERIIHMATVMQRVKDDNQRSVTDKDSEILKLVQAVAVMRKLLQGLQAELKRLDVIDEVMLTKKTSDKAVEDATLIIKEFGDQIEALKNDIENKTEIVKSLKEKLKEMKKSNDPIDRKKLRAKENVQKLLSVEIEEKKGKLRRFEKLHSGLTSIYTGVSANGSRITNSKGDPQIQEITPSHTQGTPGKTPVSEETVFAVNAQSTSAAMLSAEDIFNEDQPSREMKQVRSDISSTYSTSAHILQDSFRSHTSADLPPSEWKIRLLIYVIAGAVLSLLSCHVDPKNLPVIFGLIATPMVFALTTFEVSRYRKKAQRCLRGAGVTHSSEGGDDGDVSLVIEQLRLQMESDKELIDDMKDQLREKTLNTLASGEDDNGTDEVDVIEEQKWRIITLEEHLRSLEKAKVEDNGRVDMNFAEYKKLRDEVDILKKRREKADLEAAITSRRKDGDARGLDADIRRFNISLGWIPLLVAVAIALMQVVTLHPFAPFAVLLTLTMVVANQRFGKSTIMKKLVEERKATREQTEELDDLTELLEKEHEVIQSQKEAIDTMVREMDNEHVNLKEKRVTLAKMIWQVREMEEMRAALVEEAPSKLDDEAVKSTLKTLTKEVAEQLPDLPSDDDEDKTNDKRRDIQEPVHVASSGKRPLKVKTVATAVISVIALAVSLAYRSLTVSLLIGFQLLLGYVYRHSENETAKENETLKNQLLSQAKRSKTYKEEAVKLKRLLEAEKSFKSSDEFAKVIQDRQERRRKQNSS